MTTTKKSKTALLIDDNEIDNFINRKVLESCGFKNILTFTNSPAALKHLAETKDIPQLILLDLVLPVMNGFEFLDKFAKLDIARQPIDIFILSCTIHPNEIETAREKCSGHIDKPLTKEKLNICYRTAPGHAMANDCILI